MFCRLYEFKLSSGIDITNHQTCVKNCEYYENDSCKISTKTNIHLDSVKFGWEICRKISLDKPLIVVTSNGQYYVNSILKIIHPVNSDIWIINGTRKNKVQQIFVLILGTKNKGIFNTLDSVMIKIRNEIDYNGRDINLDDFNFDKTKKEILHVRN